MLFMAVFWVYPFTWTFILSFHDWNMISAERTFIGLNNFIKAIQDPLFLTSLRNTLFLMVLFVPAVTIASLVVALLLNRIKFLRSFFVVGYLLSYATASVAHTVVFREMFGYYGLINRLTRMIGISIPWFRDPKIAMVSIVMILIWKFTGYFALFLLAGLQAIPESLSKAAKVDGASAWQRFRHITIPLLNPALTAVLILEIMLSFVVFIEPYILTGGGPVHSTYVYLLFLYYQSFELLKAGYGSASAVIIAAVTFVIVFTVRKLVEREVVL